MKYDELMAKNQEEARLHQQLEKRKWTNQNREEDELQENCVKWFDDNFPSISKLLHHSPNEAKRTPRLGANLKRMGMRKGFPDLILLVPNKQHHCLCIEMKSENGKARTSQLAYKDIIEKSGGAFHICNNQSTFELIVTAYLQRTDESWRKKMQVSLP